MPKGSLIDFGPTAGLYYNNGKFYDANGNRVDPRNRPAPQQAQAAPAPIAPPAAPKPFALPSFDASMFPEVSMVPPVPAPPIQAPPVQQAPAPLPSFMAPPEPAQPALPSFMPPPAVSPLPTFAENIVAPPPMTQASVSPVRPTPERVPFVEKPAGGLIEARDYAPAPEMPGYAQARTGAPFRAPQAADLGNLFRQMSKTTQPFGAPIKAEDEDGSSLFRAVYGRNFY